jgi:hypothetical protein
MFDRADGFGGTGILPVIHGQARRLSQCACERTHTERCKSSPGLRYSL